MIVCLCNALSDAQLADAIAKGARRPKDVYCACGGTAQCGTCTKTILTMIRETPTASTNPAGLP
ncbi:(2Fe-2S)-binding protein [Roseicella sp. DB1501]|uniref:(2Fe-2S)-binding protein n=1 Tax=Roseicella sp. DB1501 TaxID=2730925 RepID=UPI00149257A2|nr:(2Fe-2S)-binding protein [Roseicella sp. DB1501]